MDVLQTLEMLPVGADDHVLGAADAPASLVEYGDFECPHCGETHRALKPVRQVMGRRLRFVFRHFPLRAAHPHALHAAAFAEAAAGSGQFWAAHDLLYTHQRALDDASLVAYGRTLGIEHADVLAALGGRYGEKIRRDFIGGVRSGVNGTPCLFIDGQRYDGPRDQKSLVEVLESVARTYA